MSNTILRIVHVEDWAGLYIDGELKAEGHSIDNYRLLYEMREAHLLDTVDMDILWREDLGDLGQWGHRFPEHYRELDVRTDGDN